MFSPEFSKYTCKRLFALIPLMILSTLPGCSDTEQKAEQLATLQEQMDELTREATQSALRQEQTAKIEKELAQITDKL